jgi:hypothetical protein
MEGTDALSQDGASHAFSKKKVKLARHVKSKSMSKVNNGPLMANDGKPEDLGTVLAGQFQASQVQEILNKVRMN